MSQYTLTIKQCIENDVNLFDFPYPIFDESYREQLEQKIINHFYFREIGCETVGRFKFYLKERLNLIMPYYNKMYESTLIEFDPMINYHVNESYNKLNEGENDSTATNTQDTQGSQTIDEIRDEIMKQLYSDTPHGKLSLNSDYLTNITQNENKTTGTNEQTQTSSTSENATQKTTGTNNESFEREMKGNIGVQTYSQLLNDFRSTFINVDLMVINELRDLFMQVY